MKNSSQKQFEDAILQLSRSHGIADVFSDFLDFCLLFMNWPSTKPSDFLPLEKKYGDQQAGALFAQAFHAIGDIADDHGQGFKDPFGDFFMEHLSSARTGQFFTPEDMCTMMAQMTLGDAIPEGARIADPCCGSGRNLLAAARINRKALFYGADIDINCCKMCVINLVLNSMCGEVAWMNTITMKHYRSWRIELSCKIPYCFEIPQEQSVLANVPVVQKPDQHSDTSRDNKPNKKNKPVNKKPPAGFGDSQLQFLFD